MAICGSSRPTCRALDGASAGVTGAAPPAALPAAPLAAPLAPRRPAARVGPPASLAGPPAFPAAFPATATSAAARRVAAAPRDRTPVFSRIRDGGVCFGLGRTVSRRTVRPSSRGNTGAEGMADGPEPGDERAHGLSIAQLLAAVENELIPRLLVSHSTEIEAERPAAASSQAPPHGPWAGQEQVARFAAHCAAGELDALREHVSSLLSRGIGLDAVYLHLFAPAARHLGEQWSSDEISFVDVQLGLGRLHQMVCECGPIGFRHEPDGAPRSILLCAAPGEQHTFGVTLAAEFFRRHGWQVSNLCGLEPGFVLERLASTHYTAAGFSLHNENCYAALGEEIARARERALNPDLLILVGGDYFARNPAQVSAVGADLSAGDAHDAVFAAERALDSTTVTA